MTKTTIGESIGGCLVLTVFFGGIIYFLIGRPFISAFFPSACGIKNPSKEYCWSIKDKTLQKYREDIPCCQEKGYLN